MTAHIYYYVEENPLRRHTQVIQRGAGIPGGRQEMEGHRIRDWTGSFM